MTSVGPGGVAAGDDRWISTNGFTPGLVSVIVPVYNGHDYLARAVRSVQEQTYRSFEIVVVDDGSTDGSLALARDLAVADERIRVFSMENSGGPARPRNHAIRRARGEFVAYLDQDDFWAPRKLELQLAKFRTSDFAVVYGDATYLDPLNPAEDGLLVSQRPAHEDRFGGLPEGRVTRELIRGNFAQQLTVVIRRDWVARVGPMDETARGVDCYEYLLRIGLAGGTFGAVTEALGVHDRRVDSLSRDQRTALDQSLRFFERLSAGHPEYAEDWAARIGEYRHALIDADCDTIADRARPLRERGAAFLHLARLHPPTTALRASAGSLLPAPALAATRRALAGVRSAVARSQARVRRTHR